MKVTCPSCEWSADVPDEKIPAEGRKGTCPKCQTKFDVKRTANPILEQAPINRLHIGGDGNLNCPNCSSDNTQTVKMACLSGTTTGSSTAIGINSNLSVGVASIDSKSHTNLVATLRPGSKPGYGCFNLSLAIICAVLMFVGLASAFTPELKSAAVVTLVPGGIILFVLFRAKEKLNGQLLTWNEKIRMYESGWICHRCGKTWIPGEVPHVEINHNPKPRELGQYKKSLVGVSIVIALFALMALVTPKPTPSKASNPTPSKTIPPTPQKPELVNNNLDPMAMNVKMKHPDWSDEICTAVGKGELVKGMNSAQVSATVESKRLHETVTPKSINLTADEFAAICRNACSQISGFPVGSVDYNACVYACTH